MQQQQQLCTTVSLLSKNQHLYFMLPFYVPVFIVTSYLLLLLQRKHGVNFTNMLTPSFYARRSQKCKKDSQLKLLFVLLGSARVKALQQNIDEIDPR